MSSIFWPGRLRKGPAPNVRSAVSGSTQDLKPGWCNSTGSMAADQGHYHAAGRARVLTFEINRRCQEMSARTEYVPEVPCPQLATVCNARAPRRGSPPPAGTRSCCWSSTSLLGSLLRRLHCVLRPIHMRVDMAAWLHTFRLTSRLLPYAAAASSKQARGSAEFEAETEDLFGVSVYIMRWRCLESWRG